MSGDDREVCGSDVEMGALRDRIAEELAALGEPPLSEDEDDDAFVFAGAGGAVSADLDVSTVDALARWADVPSRASDVHDAAGPMALPALSEARVWRAIEQRADDALQPPEPQENAQQARRRVTSLHGVAVAVVAVAAGIMLIPVFTTPSAPEPSPVVNAAPRPTRDDVLALAKSARAGLTALDRLRGEPVGPARARAMTRAYALRLASEGSPG